MVILDTSALIEILGGTEKGLKLRERLKEERLATTPMNINEALITTKDRERETFKDFIETLKIVPFDKDSGLKSVEIENELMKSGKLIGKLDLFVASICVQKNIPIATFDKDFEKVNGLEIIST